jgi:SecD/SecF fusion protein
MQNRGAIRLFAIIFAAICVYQLSFTFVSRQVENNAKEYANAPEVVEKANDLANGDMLMEGLIFDSISKAREKFYLDSLQNAEVYNILVTQYTYKEVKELEINLGLDLKGGMNVTLEVSVPDIILALSGKSKNETFRNALAGAREKQKNSDAAFLTLFEESINEIDPNFSLASVFSTIDLKDKIDFNSTNQEVLTVLEDEIDGAIDRTFNILNTRINRFGVAQPNIQKLSTNGRILVELPGIKDPDRVRKLLQGTAQLEFWETWEFSESIAYFNQANSELADINAANRKTEEVTDESEKTSEILEEIFPSADSEAALTENNSQIIPDSTDGQPSLAEEIGQDTSNLLDERLAAEQYYENNPIFEFLSPNFQQDPATGNFYPSKGATVGYASIKDTAAVNSLIKRGEKCFPQ